MARQKKPHKCKRLSQDQAIAWMVDQALDHLIDGKRGRFEASNRELIAQFRWSGKSVSPFLKQLEAAGILERIIGTSRHKRTQFILQVTNLPAWDEIKAVCHAQEKPPEKQHEMKHKAAGAYPNDNPNRPLTGNDALSRHERVVASLPNLMAPLKPDTFKILDAVYEDELLNDGQTYGLNLEMDALEKIETLLALTQSGMTASKTEDLRALAAV